MSKWLFSVVLLLASVAVGVGVFFYFGNQLRTEGSLKDIVSDTKEMKRELVGDDADEHGCAASAGYSWCQEKQKCLREWEESCSEPEVEEEATADQIKALFANKYNKPLAAVILEINQETSTHATGLIRFEGDISGAMWLAHKEDIVWVLDFDGQGTIPCESVQPFNYPANMVSECWDDASGTLTNL